MSFPRYPKYKDSGVEWLGNVPEHWEVGKCGFYLTVLSGFAFPSAGFSGDASNAKLLRGINVGVSKLKWDETVYWQRMEGDDLDIYELTAGDVVIGKDRPEIGDGMRVAKVTPSDLPCLLLQRVASLATICWGFCHLRCSSRIFHRRPRASVFRTLAQNKLATL